MLKYLFILFSVIYIYTLINSFLEIRKINSIIEVLKQYAASVTIDSHGNITLDKNYNETLNILLFHYPKIVDCLGFYTPPLEYGASPRDTYQNAACICNALLMKRNYAIDNFRKSLNPFVSVKKLFHIPSTLFKWIGFNFNSNSNKFINILGWLFTYLSSLYSSEIKMLISTFFKK